MTSSNNTQLKAKPGEYIFDNAGLAIGRINNDLTEDNRFTAYGKCSIANGIIKAAGYSPKNPESFHKDVQSKPNGYVLMGYTICLELSELPVEMWAVKAAEILGGEYDDLKQMLEELSKKPEIERKAKLTALSKMFAKEKKAITNGTKIKAKTKREIKDFEKAFSTMIKKFSRFRYLSDGHYGGAWYEYVQGFVVATLHGKDYEINPRYMLYGWKKDYNILDHDIIRDMWDEAYNHFIATYKHKTIRDKRSLAKVMNMHSHKYGSKQWSYECYRHGDYAGKNPAYYSFAEPKYYSEQIPQDVDFLIEQGILSYTSFVEDITKALIYDGSI